VLIEAMACGVPVVATASAGTRDIVRHGTDGLLVEGHTPQAVAAGVIGILDSEPRRAAMSLAAIESADRFAIAQVAGRYDAVLEPLAS
jgi:glycosyltransferase involved in cell wall biosynthesis